MNTLTLLFTCFKGQGCLKETYWRFGEGWDAYGWNQELKRRKQWKLKVGRRLRPRWNERLLAVSRGDWAPVGRKLKPHCESSRFFIFLPYLNGYSSFFLSNLEASALKDEFTRFFPSYTSIHSKSWSFKQNCVVLVTM